MTRVLPHCYNPFWYLFIVVLHCHMHSTLHSIVALSHYSTESHKLILCGVMLIPQMGLLCVAYHLLAIAYISLASYNLICISQSHPFYLYLAYCYSILISVFVKALMIPLLDAQLCHCHD